MNNDLISRKALKEALENAYEEYDGYDANDLRRFAERVDEEIDNAPTVEPDVNCSHCDYFKFTQTFIENIVKLMTDHNFESVDDLMNEINRVKDELGGRE